MPARSEPAPVGGIVTAILPDPRSPGAVRVALDGRITWTISRAAAERVGIAPGQVLDESLAGALAESADAEAAWRAVLRHLERRPFARGDLARRLRQRGHPEAAVEEALERAGECGLLDDRRFARGYVETRAQRGRGPARLRADLARLRVDPRIVEEVLRELWPDGEGVDDMIRTLAARRAAQLAGLPREARRRRLAAYLARRGFTGPEARQAVQDVTG